MKKILLFIPIILCIIIVLIIIKTPKELELTYQTNGGVPYEWVYEIEDTSIVEFVKSYEIDNQNKNGLVGAPISTNYVFKGLKKGTTKITFKYISIIDETISKEEVLNIKVDRNRNISLVAISN